MPSFANRVADFGTTIFTEINQLANQHQAVNLGQGRPDFDGPDDIVAAAIQALNSDTANQYAPSPGLPSLREGVAKHAGIFYNLDVDPNAGVIITASDEVYEHLIFEGHQHIAIASLDGMFERTVTVGSAGKTFGMTGWKIGWVYGHPDLMTGVWRAHQFIVFATNHPTQAAVAYAFTLGNSYYEEYQALYTRKRELVMQVIDAAGMSAIQPEGTYFIMGDFSRIYEGNDVEFCKYLIEHIGVATIPPSAFFSPNHKHLAENHVRFAFCKSDETLEQAAEKMAKLRL